LNLRRGFGQRESQPHQDQQGQTAARAQALRKIKQTLNFKAREIEKA